MIFNRDLEMLEIGPNIMRLFFFGMGFWLQLATQASFTLGQLLISLHGFTEK